MFLLEVKAGVTFCMRMPTLLFWNLACLAQKVSKFV